MRLPLLLLLVVLLATVALVTVHEATAQAPVSDPTESEELLDDPHQGRFVYLCSGAPILLQASPLYAAAVAPNRIGAKGLHTPPDGLELNPLGDRPDLIESGVTLFRVPYSAAPRGLELSLIHI